MPFGPFVGPFGSVVLGGTQFSTDPSPYEPLNWAKRHSIQPVIGGGVVIQDFGTFMRDNTLKLGSGNERFMALDVVLALHTKFRAPGATYLFTDWLSNQFMVFIKAFVPVPFKMGGDGLGNTVSLFTYTMDLQVTTILKLLGTPYSEEA
jgi:hypothetical protein